jgi:hypothetical protein
VDVARGMCVVEIVTDGSQYYHSSPVRPRAASGDDGGSAPRASPPPWFEAAVAAVAAGKSTWLQSLPMMALVKSDVDARPPRSPVRYLPSRITPSTADCSSVVET